MSVTQVPLRPVAKGTLIKLWLAVAALIAIAYGVAYFGAGQFKTVTVDTVAAGNGPLIGEMDGVIIEYTGRTENGTFSGRTEVWQMDAAGLLTITVTDRATGAQSRTATATYRRSSDKGPAA